MAAYVQLMPALVQRRMADYEAASAVPHAAAEQLETLKLKEPVDLGLGAACV